MYYLKSDYFKIFALNTGLQKAEILNLKWLNVHGGEITIMGKGQKVRTVPLNKVALEVLERSKNKSEYVFDVPNRNQTGVLKWTYKKIQEMTGNRFWLHGLRHAFVTGLVEAGVDFPTISELVGHSRLSTSLIYAHTNGERKREAVQRLLI